MESAIGGMIRVHKREHLSGLVRYIDKYEMRNMLLFEPFEIYHENSKLRRHQLGATILSVIPFFAPDAFMYLANNFQSYSFCEKIKLPKNLELDGNIGDVIKNRRSIRHFTSEPLLLEEVSTILYYSYGITNSYDIKERYTGKEITIYERVVPSGGGLYPIDLYVGILNVEEIDHGIYHYNVKEHCLEKLKVFDENSKSKFLDAFPVESVVDVENAGIIIMLVGSFWRNAIKYGGRAYRYTLQESGHTAQNIYLCTTALNLGCVALGGFYDDELNNFIGIDGVDESLIYPVVVGKPNNSESKIKSKSEGETL
jgi:SagB-type dehydrogenase family enzyme